MSDLSSLKDKGAEYWLRVIAGAAVAYVLFAMVSNVVGAIHSYQENIGFGETPTVQGAVQEALVEIIGALASIGTAVILVARELVVDKFKAWWNKK